MRTSDKQLIFMSKLIRKNPCYQLFQQSEFSKIFDVNFFQFFEKQTPKLAFWDLANMERNKVRKFG